MSRVPSGSRERSGYGKSAAVRALLQRVSEAEVTSDGEQLAVQGPGLVVLLGVADDDSASDLHWLVRKIAAMRIFEDPEGKMNLSVKDIAGAVTVVSQFTLCASTKKGNRPSFLGAAPPATAEPLYQEFCLQLESELGQAVGRGRFGADMKVRLTNDGPVTIWLDSQQPE